MQSLGERCFLGKRWGIRQTWGLLLCDESAEMDPPQHTNVAGHEVPKMGLLTQCLMGLSTFVTKKPLSLDTEGPWDYEGKSTF